MQPVNVQIKKEYVKPEIVDVNLNTSDDGEKSDAYSSRRSTGTTEHADKPRTSVDTVSEGVDKTRFSRTRVQMPMRVLCQSILSSSLSSRTSYVITYARQLRWCALWPRRYRNLAIL